MRDEFRENKKKKMTKQKGLKRFRQYLLRGVIFVVFILLIGCLYERIGGYKDEKNYLPVGKMVEVNNHKINVFSKGEGNSTVVFTGGLNEPSSYADFYPLYNEISNYTRIVTYDRPGHGWS
ncbi:alpha/beta fold hydrolase [Clostridium sp. Marseille-Q7071]